jgi:ribose transport system permease protein
MNEAFGAGGARRGPGELLAAVPGVAYILALMVIAFGALSRDFLSAPNLLNVGMQSSILLIIALPMTLIIISEGLDISLGAVLTLASVVLALVLARGGGLALALAAAIGVGLVFGLANGLLVSRVQMPPFVATLGTFGMAQGLALAVTDGQSVVGLGESLPAVYAGSVLGVPAPLLLALGAYAAAHGLLYHTRFGAYVFAIGGNREALVLSGVRVHWHHVGVYVFGGVMAGVAALLLTARMNAGHPTAAIGMEFDAIVAVAVGGTSFERGDGWLFGTVLGVLAVGALRNGLNLLGVPSSLQVVSIGVLVIVALLIDGFKRRR